MRFRFPTLAAAAATCAFPLTGGLLHAQQGAPSPTLAEIEEYIRFQDGTAAKETPRLETAIARFVHPDGYEIDLVGVVHFADAAYWDRMNELLKDYDSVLYEMVGGPVPSKDPAKTARVRLHASDDPLALLQKKLKEVSLDRIQLQYQKTGIDYSPKNFVHADATWDQFKELRSENGEDIVAIVMKLITSQKNGNVPEFFAGGEADQLLTRAIQAFTSGDGHGMKLALAEVLGHADDLTEMLAGEEGSVLIDERNKIALAKAYDQIARGDRKLCLLYGAAHMEDFEERLVAGGFKKKSHRWEAAWDLSADENAQAPEPVDLVKDVLLDEEFILTLLRKVKEGL